MVDVEAEAEAEAEADEVSFVQIDAEAAKTWIYPGFYLFLPSPPLQLP